MSGARASAGWRRSWRPAEERFRPILMTTLAAVFGAVPLALASGAGSELRQPLGITIIGGLLLSQLLTLYTTPVVYLALDGFGRKRPRTAARWRRPNSRGRGAGKRQDEPWMALPAAPAVVWPGNQNFPRRPSGAIGTGWNISTRTMRSHARCIHRRTAMTLPATPTGLRAGPKPKPPSAPCSAGPATIRRARGCWIRRPASSAPTRNSSPAMPPTRWRCSSVPSPRSRATTRSCC